MRNLNVGTHIAFNEVSLLPHRYAHQLLRAFSRVVKSTTYLRGVENDTLTCFFQKQFNTPYVQLLGSGHDALYFAIKALHLRAGDEVIMQANSYPTVFPLVQAGIIRPTLCDVDENGQMSVHELVKRITPRTNAVIVTHLFGLTANIKEIVKLCKSKGIILIEDCAQAYGSKFDHKLLGTFGDIGCFSFYPTKNLSTLGDGGALITKKKKVFEYVQKAAAYGATRQYESEFISHHSRLPELQAAALNVYTTICNKHFVRRQKLFVYYVKQIEKNLTGLVKPLASHPNSQPVPHLMVITLTKRDALKQYLADKGIITRIHYPKPVHLVPAFSFLHQKRGAYPCAEKLAETQLSIPFHSFLTHKQIDYVIASIQAFFDIKT